MIVALVAGATGVVAVLLALVILARRRDTTREVASPAVELDPSVGEFLDAINTSVSERDEKYTAALARLRADPEKSAAAIERAYLSLDSNQLWARESLLLAAAALADSSLLPFLRGVVGEPIEAPRGHEGGRALEDSVLRALAVDGIAAIARTGDASAADVLRDLTGSPDRTVQAAGVVALKYDESVGDGLERLSRDLPPERRYLLDIVRADVRDVPQIADPRRHLLAEPMTIDTRPDPDTGERRNASVPRKRARIPRAESE